MQRQRRRAYAFLFSRPTLICCCCCCCAQASQHAAAAPPTPLLAHCWLLPHHPCLPRFRVYFNRLVAPQVPPGQRPPPLKLGSHWQLWSWLIPVFTVSDEELLQLTGLHALVGAGMSGKQGSGRGCAD